MEGEIGNVLGDFFLMSEDSALTDIDLISTQELFFTKSNDENRFATPVSGNDLTQKLYDCIPKKTRDNNKWAIKLWTEWALYRITRPETYTEDSKYPLHVDISKASDECINFWMSRFISEIRRKDGTDYPPNTLNQITAGIQRYLRSECSRPTINFLKKDDKTFHYFRQCLDARMKELTNKGVGTTVNRADPVLPDDEKKLWSSGVFSMDTAQGLSNAVFFYNCKIFAFRASDEHRNLDVSQYSIKFDPETNLKFLQFNGRSCKNVQGGLNQRKIETKHINHFEQKDNEHCVVKIFEKYLSLIPREGAFYRRPLDMLKYSSQVIGEKKLSNMMKHLFVCAGIDFAGRKITNHSGKVTCCTALYNSGFDDQTVKSRSGHRSSAVELYKRPLKNLQMSVSNALNAPCDSNSVGMTDFKSYFPIKSESNKENAETCGKRVSETVTSTADNATLKITVPNGITDIIIEQNGKKIKLSL